MMKKIKRVVKNGLRKAVEHRRMLVCALTYGMMQANMMICYADTAENNDVTKGLDTLETLVFAFISGTGTIILGKNVMEFATAYQQADTSGMNSALKGIVGGFVMIAITPIVNLIK